jgi:hypothetical protein
MISGTSHEVMAFLARGSAVFAGAKETYVALAALVTRGAIGTDAGARAVWTNMRPEFCALAIGCRADLIGRTDITASAAVVHVESTTDASALAADGANSRSQVIAVIVVAALLA